MLLFLWNHFSRGSFFYVQTYIYKYKIWISSDIIFCYMYKKFLLQEEKIHLYLRGIL